MSLKKPDYLKEAPLGMWYEPNPTATRKPFRARWRLSDGTGSSQGFPTEEARATFAGQWVKQREEHGKAVKMVNDATVRAWHEADTISGGVEPVALAKFYVKYHGIAGGQLSFDDGVLRFWEIRKDKKISPDTKTHLELHFARMAAEHGKLRLNQFTPEIIRKWYRGLKNPDAADGKFSTTSIRNHLRSITTFFEVMVANQLADRNPCDAVEAPSVDEKDKIILTPRQAFDYFKANRDTPAVGPSAVECFGGLRFTSAARLTLDRIKDSRRGIEMPGHLHKSKKRKYRQGHPNNLWAWIGHAPESAWAMEQWQYNNAKRAAFVRAELKPVSITTIESKSEVERMRNVFRNSFVSYMLALTKNTPLVSYLAQHSHTSTTEIYEGIADEDDARLFLSITPESVLLTWEAFVTRYSGAKPADLVPGL